MIRDSGGVVVAALSKKMALPLGALETEAKALEEGIQFACDVGVRDVILGSDYEHLQFGPGSGGLMR